jgi:hypothetical protein
LAWRTEGRQGREGKQSTSLLIKITNLVIAFGFTLALISMVSLASLTVQMLDLLRITYPGDIRTVQPGYKPVLLDICCVILSGGAAIESDEPETVMSGPAPFSACTH